MACAPPARPAMMLSTFSSKRERLPSAQDLRPAKSPAIVRRSSPVKWKVNVRVFIHEYFGSTLTISVRV